MAKPHTPLAISLEQLRPYVSVLFYDLRTAELTEDVLLQIVEGNLQSLVGEAHEKGLMPPVHPIARERSGRWEMLGCWYALETLPSWLERLDPSPPNIPYDVRHHLALFGITTDRRHGHPFAALLSTDPPVKKKLVALMREIRVARVAEEELIPTFLKGASRRAWLRGVHQPVAVKADAKTLTGLDLREAIDPIDDQSFRLDAAVSETRSAKIVDDFRRNLPPDSRLRDLPALDAIGRAPAKRENEFVGLSLRLGTVWTGTSRSFSHFLVEVDDLCAQIAEGREKPPEQTGYKQRGYSLLARPEDDLRLDMLGEAVDFSIPVPLPEEEEQLDEPGARTRALQDWLERGEFVFERGDEQRLILNAVYDGRVVADVRIQPILGEHGSAKLDITAPPRNDPKPSQEDIDRLEEVLQDAGERTSIWFSHGYTLQAERIYRTEYRDIPFTSWKWMPFRRNKLAYAIDREKPRQSRLWEDDWKGHSLFEFVLRNVQPLFQPANKDWYLLCDDGSGEIADFIYIDAEAKCLRLIHVKASGGDDPEPDVDAAGKKRAQRGIAPAKYEIVVSQARKNLRFLDPSLLRKRLLAQRHERRAKSKDYDMEKLTWIGGKKAADRSAAIDALEQMGAYVDRGLVVLQPHTTRSVWEKAEEVLRATTSNGTNPKMSDSDRIQLLRLKTLLAALDDDCRRFSAIFEAWGVNDGADEGAAFPRSELR